MSSPLKQNTTKIQELLDIINSLPEAGGVELPELSSPASAEEVFLNKEFIDEDGNSVTGTFTIDAELTTQDNLITQIVSTLQNKASATPTLQTKTVTPTTAIQNVTPDNGYDGLSKVTVNAMPTATQATPSITVNSSGLITASATQSAGYVAAGTKSATKQLTTQAAKTITPSKSSQTAVASGRYTTGAVTVAAIPSQYITTTDATAVAADIRSGETAYVNGSKVTGTIEDFDGSYECSGDSTGGGSSGGASIETCTAVLNKTFPGATVLRYTTLDSNGCTMVDETTVIARTGEVECVKGSVLALEICSGTFGSIDGVSIDGNASLFSKYGGATSGAIYVYNIPTNAEDVVNITITCTPPSDE